MTNNKDYHEDPALLELMRGKVWGHPGVLAVKSSSFLISVHLTFTLSLSSPLSLFPSALFLCLSLCSLSFLSLSVFFTLRLHNLNLELLRYVEVLRVQINVNRT